MDHVKLRAFIDTDPANNPPATDEAVLAWGDALVHGAKKRSSSIMSILLITREYGAIKVAADAGNTDAIEVVAFVGDRDRVVDYDNPVEVTAIETTTTALVAAALISATTKTTIDTLGVNKVSRWEKSGLGRPTLHDIAVARSL